MRPLWYSYPEVKSVEQNETTFCFGDAILVSIHPEKNKVPQGIESEFEFDERGEIVKSDGCLPMKWIRQQIAQGSIVPLVTFDNPNSTKAITDNLSSLKMDIHVFGLEAEGYIYIDDMLTFDKKSMFLHIKYANSKWEINAKKNDFEQVRFDENLEFEKQKFVNKIIYH